MISSLEFKSNLLFVILLFTTGLAIVSVVFVSVIFGTYSQTGPTGPRGLAGARGPKGDTGDTGAQGDPGAPGICNTSGLVDNVTFISDSTDATIRLGFDVAGSTGTQTILRTVQTSNRIITFPDRTDTLMGVTTFDTMTHKTINTGSNDIIISAAGNTNINSLVNQDVTTVGSPSFAGLTLSSVPATDNTQTQILARDSTTGAIVKRTDLASIITVSTTQTWSSTAFAGTATVTTIYRKIGSQVTMFSAGFTKAITGAGYIYSDPIPASMRPASGLPILVPVYDNSAVALGTIIYDTGGGPTATTFRMGNGASGNPNWSGPGSMGTPGFYAVYTLD
jgi:hypothetical protein